MRKFYGGILQDTICPLDNKKIIDILGDELLTGTGSAINGYDCLAGFMKSLNPVPIDVIEIGTFLGMGSALLASYSRSVFTFDIKYRNSHPLWIALGLDRRINCYTGEQDFIDYILKALKNDKRFNFNFAFIDGMHKVENIKHDFELVKFCKRVLFHDVQIPEINKFLTEIGGYVINADSKEPAKFGYWKE